MQKYLVTTDIHITSEGKQIIGLDPLDRFLKVLASAAADHPDAQGMIVMGDLTHWGGPNEYARLKSAFKDLPWPVHLMIGNHDNRANFSAAFPETPVTAEGHIQQVLAADDWRLILLDSHDETFAEPVHSGLLCEQRLAWLRAELDQSAGMNVVICIHHPPMRTFFDGMDDIGLRNKDQLLDLLGEYKEVRQIVAGHIHRTISGTVRHLPITVFKSPCHQMPLVLGVDGSDHAVDEPGAYGLLLLHDDGVTIHTQDVMPAPA